MKKAKKKKCGNCIYWKHDKDLHKIKQLADKKGFCHLEPPKLMQNIVPAVIREVGLDNIRQRMEHFQFLPVRSENDIGCRNHEK